MIGALPLLSERLFQRILKKNLVEKKQLFLRRRFTSGGLIQTKRFGQHRNCSIDELKENIVEKRRRRERNVVALRIEFGQTINSDQKENEDDQMKRSRRGGEFRPIEFVPSTYPKKD